jgi:hypothetical protein
MTGRRIALGLAALLCCGAAARAQTPAPDGLAVEKYSWAKERIGWERDPFGGPVESFDDMRRRRVDERRLERAQRSGNIGEANKVEREMRAERVIRARPSEPPRYAFHYRLVVRNGGGKPVKELDWDYVFLDAATGEEMGRRQFTAVERITPGKRKELDFLVPTPPTQKVSAHALVKGERDGLVERVVIVRVLYEDGTVWQAGPPAP